MLKLFNRNRLSKKDYQEKVNELIQENKSLDLEVTRLTQKMQDIENNSKKSKEELIKRDRTISKQGIKINNYISEINNLKLELEKCQETIKKQNGAKGGFVARINSLKQRILELEKDLEESLSDKYYRVKIPSGKKPKAQAMNIKGRAVQSKIIKTVTEE